MRMRSLPLIVLFLSFLVPSAALPAENATTDSLNRAHVAQLCFGGQASETLAEQLQPLREAFCQLEMFLSLPTTSLNQNPSDAAIFNEQRDLTSESFASLGNADFNSLLMYVMKLYSTQPNLRPQLDLLLSSLQEKVLPELTAQENYNVLSNFVGNATGYAMLALVLVHGPSFLRERALPMNWKLLNLGEKYPKWFGEGGIFSRVVSEEASQMPALTYGGVKSWKRSFHQRILSMLLPGWTRTSRVGFRRELIAGALGISAAGAVEVWQALKVKKLDPSKMAFGVKARLVYEHLQAYDHIKSLWQKKNLTPEVADWANNVQKTLAELSALEQSAPALKNLHRDQLDDEQLQLAGPDIPKQMSTVFLKDEIVSLAQEILTVQQQKQGQKQPQQQAEQERLP